MTNISVSYTCKYQICFAPEYKYTTCGKCYNSKTGRIIRQVLKSGCIGYCLRGKFYSLTKLRKCLEIINDPDCPF